MLQDGHEYLTQSQPCYEYRYPGVNAIIWIESFSVDIGWGSSRNAVWLHCLASSGDYHGTDCIIQEKHWIFLRHLNAQMSEIQFLQLIHKQYFTVVSKSG